MPSKLGDLFALVIFGLSGQDLPQSFGPNDSFITDYLRQYSSDRPITIWFPYWSQSKLLSKTNNSAAYCFSYWKVSNVEKCIMLILTFLEIWLLWWKKLKEGTYTSLKIVKYSTLYRLATELYERRNIRWIVLKLTYSMKQERRKCLRKLYVETNLNSLFVFRDLSN